MSRRAASTTPQGTFTNSSSGGHMRANSSNVSVTLSAHPSFPLAPVTSLVTPPISGSTNEPNQSKRPKPLAANPGGVLSTHRWNVLEEGRVNVDLACRAWPGKMELDEAGQRRFIIEYSSFPALEVKRQEVIHELITTEQEYVRDLRIIIDIFMHNMKTMNLTNQQGLDTIFSNVDAIAKANEAFLAALYERKARDLGLPQEVGDIFCTMADQFRVYNTYCSNQNAAMEFLQQNKNTELGIFIQFCAMKPEARGLDLSFFLIKPVQRICKYPLLLRELAKNTNADHADFRLLERAIESISAVVDYVNEKKRQAEQYEHMMATLAKIEFTDSMSLPTNPDRYIVYEGTLYKASKSTMKKVISSQRWAILFNDCLVIAKSGMFSNSKHQVNAVFSIWSIGIGNIDDTDRIKNAFEIKVDDKRSFIYCVSTSEEKKKWINVFSQAIDKATKVLHNNDVKKVKTLSQQVGKSKPLPKSRSQSSLTDLDKKKPTILQENVLPLRGSKKSLRASVNREDVGSQEIASGIVRSASDVSINIWRAEEQCLDDDLSEQLNPTNIIIQKDTKSSLHSLKVKGQPTINRSASASNLKPNDTQDEADQIRASTSDRDVSHTTTSSSVEEAKPLVIAGKLIGPVAISFVKEAKSVQERPAFPKTQVTIANVETVRDKFLKNNNLPRVPGPAPSKPPASYKPFVKPGAEKIPTVPQSPGKIFTAVNEPVDILSPTASPGIRARIAALVSQNSTSSNPGMMNKKPSSQNLHDQDGSRASQSSNLTVNPGPSDTIKNKINALKGAANTTAHSRTESYEFSSGSIRPSAVKKSGLYANLKPSGSQSSISEITASGGHQSRRLGDQIITTAGNTIK